MLLEDWGWVLWGLAARGGRGCVLHKARWAPRAGVGAQLQHRGGGIRVGSFLSCRTLQPQHPLVPLRGAVSCQRGAHPGAQSWAVVNQFYLPCALLCQARWDRSPVVTGRLV